MTSFNLKYLFKGPTSKESHSEVYRGLRLQRTNLGGGEHKSHNNTSIYEGTNENELFLSTCVGARQINIDATVTGNI